MKRQSKVNSVNSGHKRNTINTDSKNHTKQTSIENKRAENSAGVSKINGENDEGSTLDASEAKGILQHQGQAKNSRTYPLIGPIISKIKRMLCSHEDVTSKNQNDPDDDVLFKDDLDDLLINTLDKEDQLLSDEELIVLYVLVL